MQGGHLRGTALGPGRGAGDGAHQLRRRRSGRSSATTRSGSPSRRSLLKLRGLMVRSEEDTKRPELALARKHLERLMAKRRAEGREGRPSSSPAPRAPPLTKSSGKIRRVKGPGQGRHLQDKPAAGALPGGAGVRLPVRADDLGQGGARGLRRGLRQEAEEDGLREGRRGRLREGRGLQGPQLEASLPA